MPQPVSNTLTVVSGSLLANKISYVVDGQNRNYRGGYGGLSWMSEAEATNNVIFIGNTSTIGRGPADKPLFYPSFNTSDANIIYAANTLPGSPRNFTTVAGAYGWAANNNFFINSANSPIPRIDADGLAFYVDANQPTSYPQTNNDWFDLSGNGRNSTLINGPVWNSRGWIEFDGADDRSTTSFGFLSNNESHEAWIYSKGNVSSYNMFMGIILPYYGFWQGNQYIVQDFIGGAQVGYIAGSLSLNRWYHFLSTRSYNGTNTTLTTYINGTLSNQSTYSGAPSIAGGTWAIGNWDVPSAGSSYPFYGDISGVKIYTKSLSLAEVKQNYFQSNIVTDGLVFMADANNLVSYPRSGTTTYNLTGSGATGTLTNGTSFNSSNGGSFVFDGTNDYIVFPNDTNLDSQTITMESWSKINVQFQNGFLFEKGQVNTQYSNFYNGDGTFYFRTMGLSNQDLTFYYPSYIPTNTWSHIVCTYGAGVKTIYVNGVQIAQTTGVTGTISTNTTGLFLGAYGPGSSYFLNGNIAQSRVYNRALSASEVQQNYQATKDKFQGQQIVTNGLVLNLDSANKDSYPGTGTTWTNLASGGYNGTLTNGPTFSPNQNGGVINFDGIDDYAIVSPPTTYSEYTVQFFCKWVSSVGVSERIFGCDAFGTYTIFNPYDVGFHYNPLGGSPPSVTLPSGVNVGFGNWCNVAITVSTSGTNVVIYVNGIARNSWSTLPAANLSANIFIGRQNTLYGANCQFGNFQLYNRVLSATEILQNYDANKTRFGL